jgi:hypothetical protein
LTEPTTYNVSIPNISAVDAVNIKHQLVDVYRLIDGKDFTWAWFPEVLDEFSYFQTEPRRMEVRFVDEANATFFQLRFANDTR